MTLNDQIIATLSTAHTTAKALAMAIKRPTPSVRRNLNNLATEGTIGKEVNVDGFTVYFAIVADAPAPVAAPVVAAPAPVAAPVAAPVVAAPAPVAAPVAAPVVAAPVAVTENADIPHTYGNLESADCPRCKLSVSTAPEVEELFGVRTLKYKTAGVVTRLKTIKQSYCRGCRKVHAAERRAAKVAAAAKAAE